MRLCASGLRNWVMLAGQALFTVMAVRMSVRGGVPWLGTAGLLVLGLGTLAWAAPLKPAFRLCCRWAMIAGWTLALLVPGSLLLPFETSVTLETYLDRYLAVLAWVIAAVILPATQVHPGGFSRPKWQASAFIWALSAAVAWLTACYIYNYASAFFSAIAASAALLVMAQFCFRMPYWASLVVNTGLLLLLGLPLLDCFVRPSSTLKLELAPQKRYYNYSVARHDPAGFSSWWALFCSQFETMGRQIYVKDPTHRTPFRLRPGDQTKLFNSTIKINSRGFRGPEFSQPKGQVYRIVCLGESTTFGCTLNADDKPWAELLQAALNTRLKPKVPVEIINAGIPSFTIENSLARLETEILPLKPDMLISYHGYNGFPLLDASLPATRASAPPAYMPRPLRILALVEYRWRLLAFKHTLTAALETQPPTVSNVLETAYGRAYEQLINFSESNHIKLLIATHALAVNQESDPDVIEFYRNAFPAVYRLVAANRLHSALVRQLVALHPRVGLIEAGRNLDGEHDKFIDLVHLTQAGREQLAENIFEAIRQELLGTTVNTRRFSEAGESGTAVSNP